MMPGVSGLDAVRVIRADPALAGLPVILLTARAQESDVETGFDSGADDYITKPFSPRELAAQGPGLCSADRALSRLAGGNRAPDYALALARVAHLTVGPVHAPRSRASDPATDERTP